MTASPIVAERQVARNGRSTQARYLKPVAPSTYQSFRHPSVSPQKYQTFKVEQIDLWTTIMNNMMSTTRTMMHASRASKRYDVIRASTSVLPFACVQTTSHRFRSTATNDSRSKIQTPFRQHQLQTANYSSIAMPTPTASRVAIIGAGTVGATIAFSLIGMRL
jgi:hypothetical protein